MRPNHVQGKIHLQACFKAFPDTLRSTNIAGSSGAMADADSTELVYKIRQWVQQSCRCSTLAAGFSGLNWMIKLSWTAILCCRRTFFVMCFRRSVLLRGRALVRKDLRLPSCYRAVKMRMTGSFFLLLAAKVRSSCEEGPGQSALQSAYHDPQLDVTELKQHRTT